MGVRKQLAQVMLKLGELAGKVRDFSISHTERTASGGISSTHCSLN